jgi:hypothetical protein
MANDDEAGRRARADSLRQRIAALKTGRTGPEVAADEADTSGPLGKRKTDHETISPAESPREFVQRKMRELDRDKSASKGSDT